MCLQDVNLTAQALHKKYGEELQACRKDVTLAWNDYKKRYGEELESCQQLQRQCGPTLTDLLNNAKKTEPCGPTRGQMFELTFLSPSAKGKESRGRMIRMLFSNGREVNFVDNLFTGEGLAVTERVEWDCKNNFVKLERGFWESRNTIFFDLKNGIQFSEMDLAVWSDQKQYFFRPNKQEQDHPLEFFDCQKRTNTASCQSIWSDPVLKGPITKVQWKTNRVELFAADDFINDQESHQISIFKLSCSWNEKFQCQKILLKKVSDSTFQEEFKSL